MTSLKAVLLILFIFGTAKSVLGERIVNILHPLGEPVDNSYIEPNSGFGHAHVSVPGCPKSIDGSPWLYFGSPPRCFLAGTRGPCLPGQFFSYKPGSPYGLCVGAILPDGIGIVSVPVPTTTTTTTTTPAPTVEARSIPIIQDPSIYCATGLYNYYTQKCVTKLGLGYLTAK